MTFKILYCCQPCAENWSECCGYEKRDKLRVIPDGQWICDACFDTFQDEGDLDESLNWDALPIPPEYGPVESDYKRPAQDKADG